jgi:hypothetical protein
MGQRLVITIKNGDEDLAKIYYHWSGYTFSALLETKKIIDCIYNHQGETISEMKLRLIKFLEDNGGGIKGEQSEFDYIKKMYPKEIFKEDGYSRNNGLIALSEKGMQDLQDWSEGDVTIDIDTDTVENTVFYSYEHIDEYNKERKEWDEDFEGYKIEDLEDIGCDIGTFDIECIESIINSVYDVDNVCRFGSQIFQMIE